MHRSRTGEAGIKSPMNELLEATDRRIAALRLRLRSREAVDA